jgi:hypothetical protein
VNKKRLAAGEHMNSGMDMTQVFYVGVLDDPLQESERRFEQMSYVLDHLQYLPHAQMNENIVL